MVYGFVKQSGGNISIESAPGEGTTIMIDLPRADPEEGKKPAEQIDSIEPGGSERILVVEDDARVRKVSMRRLSALGYDVLEAASAEAALEILKQQSNIDLVFSDIVMPGGLDGVSLAEKVTEIHPGLRILLTTGYTSDMAEDETDGDGLGEARQASGWPILGKPHTKQQLARAIRDALERPAHSN